MKQDRYPILFFNYFIIPYVKDNIKAYKLSIQVVILINKFVNKEKIDVRMNKVSVIISIYNT